MKTDLIALAKEVPNLTVSVTLSDLFEFGQELVRTSKKEHEQVILHETTEKYLEPTKTALKLDVHKTTLWRWAKQGYLVPVQVGGLRRYKMSDIQRILEEERRHE